MLTHTTTALLDGLSDPANEAVWREFDARFRPVLIALGCRLGLSAEDAADAAQESLIRFLNAYRQGKYDRTKGRLRAWITGIARHCIKHAQAASLARRNQRGLSAIAEIPEEDRFAQMWDTECQREIMRQGMARLRQESKSDARTIKAFELLAFDRRAPADVARDLGMSMNDVYLAKHRCLVRLRQAIAELGELYEAP